MLEFSKIIQFHSLQALVGISKQIWIASKYLQIAKIAMSPSYYVDIWYIYLINVKDVSYFPQILSVPFKRILETGL